MKTTVNYGLKKPDGTDVVNIDDFNYNSDIIDQKLKEVDTKASNIAVPVTSINGKTGAVILSAGDIKAADGKTVEGFKTEVTSELAQKANTKRITPLELNNTKLKAGFYTNDGNGILNGDGTTFKTGWWHVQASKHFDDNGFGMQVATPLNITSESRYYRTSNGTIWDAWRKILDQRDYDQLFQYANDGKTGIANAVTAKGVSASPSDTFTTLASKIGQLSRAGLKYGVGDFLYPSALGLTGTCTQVWGVKDYSSHYIDVNSLRYINGVIIGTNHWGNGIRWIRAVFNGGGSWECRITPDGCDIRQGCVKNGAFYYVVSSNVDIQKITSNGTITAGGQNSAIGGSVLSSSDMYVYTMSDINNSATIQIRKHDPNTLATISTITCTLPSAYSSGGYYNYGGPNGLRLTGCVDSSGNIYICYDYQWTRYGRSSDDEPDYYGLYDNRMWKFASTGGSPISTLVIGSDSVGTLSRQFDGSGKVVINNNIIYQVDTRGVLRSINTALAITGSYSGVKAFYYPLITPDGKIEVSNKIFTGNCSLFNTIDGLPNTELDIIYTGLTSAYGISYTSGSYYYTSGYKLTTGYVIQN